MSQTKTDLEALGIPDDPTRLPTDPHPAQIRSMCLWIQQGWTDDERQHRVDGSVRLLDRGAPEPKHEPRASAIARWLREMRCQREVPVSIWEDEPTKADQDYWQFQIGA